MLLSRAPRRAFWKPLHAQCCAFSISRSSNVQLSYQLIEPPAGKGTDRISRDGQPIIFMHGLFGSKRNNRSISKVLARDLNRDIYIVDLRNHGDTAHTAPHNYQVMADDVEAFMHERQLNKVVLIGHSMGAKTSMVLALQSPHLVTGIVPVDNAPISATLTPEFKQYIRAMKEIEAAKVTKQSEADDILKKYEKSLPIRQFLLTNLIRSPEPSSNHFVFRIPLSILDDSLSNMGEFPYNSSSSSQESTPGGNSDAVHYDGPALFVRGTQSAYVSDKTIPAIRHFFPKAKIEDVDAGHWLISEKPEEFRSAVVKWFRESGVE